jgi:hypothetical protein
MNDGDANPFPAGSTGRPSRLVLGVLALAGLLASCAILAPPPAPPRPEVAPPPAAGRPSPAPGAPAPHSAVPFPGSPAAGATPSLPRPRQYRLGPAAAALIGQARAEERRRNLPLAAETLERALSIEPRDPLVWIELGRENILANNPTQAYGMGRKALYLASGDPLAQASAWELIAASLREEGRADAAYAAEERAVALRRP